VSRVRGSLDIARPVEVVFDAVVDQRNEPSYNAAFIIDATRSGLPVTVLHLYDGATATMRAKVLSVATVVDAAGPEMDRGETVTVFNDLMVLAPGAVVDPSCNGRPSTPTTSGGSTPLETRASPPC